MTTSIELPCVLEMVVECPRCGDVAAIAVGLHGRLVADDDGTGTLKVRVDQKAVEHVCAQTRLDRVPGFVTFEAQGRKVTIDADEGLERLESISRGEIS